MERQSMAKKATTKKPAGSKARKTEAPGRTSAGSAKAGAHRRKTGSRPNARPESMSASDAIFGLLESPLVADMLAAGAAAALAAFTQHRLSRRREGGSKQALKNAAKAAATAMGARLSEEFDEIRKSASASKSGAT